MQDREAAAEYFRQHPKEVASVLGAAGPAQQNASMDDEPNTRQWPEPPAPEAYHGLAGDVVRIIDPHTEASRVAPLIQTLLCFGNVIGRTAHFVAESKSALHEPVRGTRRRHFGRAQRIELGASNAFVSHGGL